jgi:hypothetical protein
MAVCAPKKKKKKLICNRVAHTRELYAQVSNKLCERFLVNTASSAGFSIASPIALQVKGKKQRKEWRMGNLRGDTIPPWWEMANVK